MKFSKLPGTTGIRHFPSLLLSTPVLQIQLVSKKTGKPEGLRMIHYPIGKVPQKITGMQ
jgi:hypothetical protein